MQFDTASERSGLCEEQGFALVEEGSPAFIPSAFQIAVTQFKALPKMPEAQRTGLGVGWHEHDAVLFRGTERFFRPAARPKGCRSGCRCGKEWKNARRQARAGRTPAPASGHGLQGANLAWSNFASTTQHIHEPNPLHRR